MDMAKDVGNEAAAKDTTTNKQPMADTIATMDALELVAYRIPLVEGRVAGQMN
jgi:hypothetical protein